jgi:hypothetical protein
MLVTVWLKETAQPISFTVAENAYTKGQFYCILNKTSGVVTKFPIANIWRVEESY